MRVGNALTLTLSEAEVMGSFEWSLATNRQPPAARFGGDPKMFHKYAYVYTYVHM